MLISYIDEQDPIYQFCEACIDEYAETGNEEILDYLLEAGMTDSEAMHILFANPNKEEPPALWHLAKAAIDQTKNPFEAAKLVGDAGDIPSRAQGAGIHQPQVKHVQALAFWGHPTTHKALLGMAAAGTVHGIYKYRQKSKSVIAKKIAALRKLLRKYQLKLKASRFQKEQSILKKVCANIIQAINTLLKFIEEKTDKYFSG